MERKNISLYKLTVFILTLILSPLPQNLRAAVTTSGDVTPVLIGSPDTWNPLGPVTVGGWELGTLTVTAGGSVTSPSGIIGGHDPMFGTLAEYFNPEADLGGGTGITTVTGLGSIWQTPNLMVGFSGDGTLGITDGGTVTNQMSIIGMTSNGIGTANVSNPFSAWGLSDNLVVGAWGEGDLTISNGALVTAPDVFIGGMPFDVIDEDYDPNYIPDGTGTVTVTGDGSTLQVTDSTSLYVGYFSDGTLDVNDGGQATSALGIIGAGPDAVGTMTVDGSGSAWEATEVVVGAWGEGDLSISNGGRVTAETVWIGGLDADDIEIDPEMLADFGDVNGVGTVTVTGEGSSLTVTGDDTLKVGAVGTGTLTISDGADVQSTETFIGGYATFNDEGPIEVATIHEGGPGTVTVTGTGSTLQDEILTVGAGGTGTLGISAGGTVTTNLGIIGLGPNSIGTTTVTGNRSTWNITDLDDPYESDLDGTLLVGAWGEGHLTVADGGEVNAVEMYIGGAEPNELGTETNWGQEDPIPDGTGTVTVTGDGSLLRATPSGGGGNTTYVGYNGDGTLNILDGGEVQTDAVIVGVLEDGNGLVNVDGTGSTLRIDGVDAHDVQAEGEGHMIVSNGGQVIVNDANSLLDVANSVTVGSVGAGSTLTVSGGGLVRSDSGIIGGTDPEFETLAEYFDPNTSLGDGTGTAIVTGAGSRWETESLMVGFSGDGTLQIADGGRVADQTGMIGVMSDAVGGVEVSGSDSRWINNTNLVVGAWGQGDLTISNGGHVTTPDMYIGGMPFDVVEEDYDPNLIPNGTGTVTVTGEGSSLDVANFFSLYVGYFGEATLDVNDGGEVSSELGVLGLSPDAVGTVTVQDANSAWSAAQVIVGAWGEGNLTISNGGGVTTETMLIGGLDPNDLELDPNMLADFGDVNGVGTVTVTGEGSTLTVTGDDTLYVGPVGTGTLTVSDGADVNSVETYVGGYVSFEDEGDTEVATMHDEGTGTATVTGTGSAWVNEILTVGAGGTGTLEVSAGATVSNNLSIVGLGPNSTGTATVTGTGSMWSTWDADDPFDEDLDGTLIVGAWGEGRLTVADGGQVNAADMYIGGAEPNQLGTETNWGQENPNPDGTGTVTVTGEGSVLRITEPTSLYVGFFGEGTLDVNDGGTVLSDSTGIGVMPDSIGTTTVDGDGTTWINSENTFVGGFGTGALTISNGGRTIIEETLFIGGFDTSDFDIETGELGDPNGTGTVTVTGDDSILINAPLGNSTTYVGYSGDGTLNILDGGEVQTDAAIVGELEDSTGRVNVDGAGSTLRINGVDPHVVEGEGDGEVIVSNGGQVIVDNPNGLLHVGNNGDFDSGTLTVGSEGTGSTLTVSGGGVVNSYQGVIGGYDPHHLQIGDYLGPGANLNTGTGTATVTGAGSRWNTTHLEVGFSGDGTLSINNGGRVTDTSAFIGAAPGVNGIAEVTGSGSLWDHDSDLVVGAWGNGTLGVREGGGLVSRNAYLGGMPADVIWTDFDPNYVPMGSGTVTVDGPGSLWENNRILSVGTYGEGVLTISGGGQVASRFVDIGGLPLNESEVDSNTPGFNPTGTTTVTGGGSLLGTDVLTVGTYGEGVLTISGGGQVASRFVNIGGLLLGGSEVDPNTPGFDPTGTTTVTGGGSLLEANTLVVGTSGTGTLNVLNGGGVNGLLGIIGFEPGGTGVATVDGNGSFWQLNDDGESNGTLGVGIGGNGQLTISNGGRVTATDAMVGGADVNGVDPQDYPTGNVLVTGENSSFQVLENLHIGGVGPDNLGPGSVLVSDGGLVDVGNELYVWDTGLLGGDGTVNVSAPTTLLNSGTISPGNSIGTLTVNGNVVFEPNSTYAVEISNDDTSDQLNVNGDVTINGGTVQAIAVDTIVGAHEYEIIAANSVEGTFDVLNTALVQSVADAGLDYDPNSVWLRIAAMAFNDPNIWRTENQRNVGEALQFIATNQGGNSSTAALQGLANFNQVRQAFDELCGQTRPTLGPITTSMTSNYIGAVSGGLQRGSFARSNRPGNGPLLAMAGSDPMTGMDVTTDVSPSGRSVALGNGTSVLGDAPWGIWIKEYGLFGDRDSESGVFGYRYNTYGFGVGIDNYVTDELLLGITSGYSSGQIDYYGSRNKTDTDGIYLGLYGRWTPGSWYTQAMLTYAGMEYETDRYINLTGEHLKGDLDGYDIAGYIETGTSWEYPSGWKINPLIAAQWSSLRLDSYSETGGPSALTFGSERFNSFKSAVGARISKDLSSEYDSRKLLWEVRGRWVHEFDDIQASVDAAFVTNPGVLFKVSDSELSRDSAVLGTGIKTELFENTSLSLEYDVRLNADDVAHLVSIVFDHRW